MNTKLLISLTNLSVFKTQSRSVIYTGSTNTNLFVPSRLFSNINKKTEEDKSNESQTKKIASDVDEEVDEEVNHFIFYSS